VVGQLVLGLNKGPSLLGIKRIGAARLEGEALLAATNEVGEGHLVFLRDPLRVVDVFDLEDHLRVAPEGELGELEAEHARRVVLGLRS